MTNRDPEDKNRENHLFFQIAFLEAGVITVKKLKGEKRSQPLNKNLDRRGMKNQ